MPAGFSTKLMIGRVTTSLSRTIEKWSEYCEACSAETTPGGASARPRSAMFLVTSSNFGRPSSVKSKVTFGRPEPCCSKFCSGFVMSKPESAGRSRRTKNSSGPFAASSVSVAGSSSTCGSETTIVPCGTSMISESGGCFSSGNSRKRSDFFCSGPESSSSVVLSKR